MQPFVDTEGDATGNVIGVLPGSDPDLADELIVVGAHHDHLGQDDTGIFGERIKLNQEFNRIDADGGVRVEGKGDGAGAVLNVSTDLVRWTPVGPFQAVADSYEAHDPAPRGTVPRFYQAR